jgi:hypothetical protein
MKRHRKRCPHDDVTVISATGLASGERLLTLRCAACGYVRLRIMDRDAGLDEDEKLRATATQARLAVATAERRGAQRMTDPLFVTASAARTSCPSCLAGPGGRFQRDTVFWVTGSPP